MDTPTTPPASPNPQSFEPPRKYIRTLEGDMAMLKKGGTPELQPLAAKAEPPPAPTPIPPPASPAAASVPLAAPKPPPAPEAPGVPPVFLKPEPPKSSPIETYAYDFSERMRQTNASTATVLAREQDARTGEPRILEERRTSGGVVSIVAGVLLLALGGAGAYLAYSRYMTGSQPVLIAPVSTTPIFVDEREKISGEKPAEILQAIEQSLTRALQPNTVRLLSLELSTTTSRSVFSALELSAPGVLLRNINDSGSMAGIVNVGGAGTPFFILSVSSYRETFAGMLSWESKMPGDLNALFPFYAPTAVATTTATTTTKSTKKATTTVPLSVPIFSVFFHDEVVANHDVRVYRDAEGRSIVLYGYWNQKTLVIARDPAAFAEIIGRLATSR